MKKIFFVIPVYKVEKYLERCVNSVINQTYQNVHIVLVDDGSPDNCPLLCDEFEKKHNNIKVIHKENGGLSDARNAGIKYVNTVADSDDFITFVDSDDYIHIDFARKMIELCEKNNCDMAQCGYEKGKEDFFSEPKNSENIQSISSDKALLGYRLKSQAWAKVYKVKTFSEIFFPKGVINEDEFVTYKAVYNAGKIVFTDEKMYYYFQHGTSIMDEVAKKLKNNPKRYDFLRAYEERIRFFEEKNMEEQVLRTREKICSDMILRYCEQMYLDKKDRDTDCINGTYMKIYRDNYKIMIKRKQIPLKRRLMYISFNLLPQSGVMMGKIFTLRK